MSFCLRFSFGAFFSLFLLLNHTIWAEWITTPHLFSETEEGEQPKVASDASGNAIVIWKDIDYSDKHVIFSSTFNPQTFTWNSPNLLSERGDDSKDAPALKKGHYGFAIAAFRDTSISAIQAKIFKNNWSGAETFLDSGNLSEPIIAINCASSGIIAWISSTTGLHAVICRDDGVFKHTVIDGTINTLETPLSIAVNDEGKAVLLWTTADGDIFSSLFQGEWGQTAKVNHYRNNSVLSAGIDASGSILLVFQRDDKIYFKKNVGGIWSEGLEISSKEGQYQLPKLAVDAEGGAIALWKRVDKNLLEASYYDGTKWGGVAKIADLDSSSVYKLVHDNRKNTLVIFSVHTGRFYHLKSLFHNPGLDWSTPMTIASSEFPLTNPEIALSHVFHTAFAVWESGSQKNIFGAFAPLMVPPAPPSSFQGRLKKDRFPSQTDRIHYLKWNDTIDPTAVLYRIRQKNKVIFEFPLGSKHEVVLHNRERKNPESYSISAVNALGAEGAPNTISIR